MTNLNPVLAWGGVTDPTEHDPENFRYLVHFDNGVDNGEMEPRGPYFIDDIEKLTRRERLCTSLIDHRRRRGHSFGLAHGFILHIPEVDVLATSSSDMCSARYSVPELRELFPIQEPEHVINGKRGCPVNNEVVINPGNAMIAGLIVTSSGSWLGSSHSANEIECAAASLAVPMLCIEP